MIHNSFFTFKNLYDAYLDCRENKRDTINALKFEMNLERNLFSLQRDLMERKYQPGRSICFVVKEPSPREIFAASFQDRVIHHLLINEIEDIGEKIFIYDSYSCRKNKGTHLAIKRLKMFIKKATKNYKRETFYLQLDISGFFMAIDQNILYSLVRDLVVKQQKSHQWKKEVLWLAKTIVFHRPTENYIIKGDRSLFKLIPARKSLFHSSSNKGLPIGNYSSQFFANIYLNELDQFIKRELKRKYYLRYVDDLVILGKEKQELMCLVEPINSFLKQKLDLELNLSKTKLYPLDNGISFLGYVINPGYSLVREKTVKRFKNKIDKLRKFQYEISDSKILATINSYYGHFGHANSFNLRKEIYEKYLVFLKERFFPKTDYSFLGIQ